jgi:hypothetical protein
MIILLNMSSQIFVDNDYKSFLYLLNLLNLLFNIEFI